VGTGADNRRASRVKPKGPLDRYCCREYGLADVGVNGLSPRSRVMACEAREGFGLNPKVHMASDEWPSCLGLHGPSRGGVLLLSPSEDSSVL